MGGEGRSLVDVGIRRSGFMGGVWCDRWLMWGLGDRVLWVVRVRSVFDVEI